MRDRARQPGGRISAIEWITELGDNQALLYCGIRQATVPDHDTSTERLLMNGLIARCTKRILSSLPLVSADPIKILVKSVGHHPPLKRHIHDTEALGGLLVLSVPAASYTAQGWRRTQGGRREQFATLRTPVVRIHPAPPIIASAFRFRDGVAA